MSSLTDEWQLKTSENSIKYIIDIENFDKKIKTFRIGRSIYSKDFKIGRSTFSISLYPGGESKENKDYVSIFLNNRSDWRVKAKATISIPDRGFVTKEIYADYFQPVGSSKGSWGFGDFVHHNRFNRNDLLSNCGVLTLQLDVELLEEEVLQSRDLTKENTIERCEILEKTVKDLKDTIENMEDQSRRQTNELKKMQMVTQDLTLAVSKLPKPAQSQPRPSLDVECPVCMEVARPPMRLMQCGKGHIVCDSCHARGEGEASAAGARDRNPRINLCHTCREVITGRPSALERVLGLS